MSPSRVTSTRPPSGDSRGSWSAPGGTVSIGPPVDPSRFTQRSDRGGGAIGDVDERPAVRHRVVKTAGHDTDRSFHVLRDRRGTASGRQTADVKGNRHQRSPDAIDDYPIGHIPRVAGAAHDDAARSGSQRVHGHVAVVDRTRRAALTTVNSTPSPPGSNCGRQNCSPSPPARSIQRCRQRPTPA